jgi:hypothetical protein
MTMFIAQLFKDASDFYSRNYDAVSNGTKLGQIGYTVYNHQKTVKAAKLAEQLKNAAPAEGQAVEETVENVGKTGIKGFLANNKVAVGRTLGGVGILFSVGGIFHSVANEKGKFLDTDRDGNLKVGHKGERLIASTATAAPGLAVSGFQLATAGATATVGTSVAAIAVPAVAAYVIDKDAETVIETRRLYEGVDNAFTPGKHQTRHKAAGPNAGAYDNLMPAARLLSKYMVDSNLSHPMKRAKDGSIADIRELDLTDGRNRRELRRVLNEAIAREQKAADDNSSLIPRWARFGHGVEAEQEAQMNLHQLESAETELGQFAAEVTKWKKSTTPAPKFH